MVLGSAQPVLVSAQPCRAPGSGYSSSSPGVQGCKARGTGIICGFPGQQEQGGMWCQSCVPRGCAFLWGQRVWAEGARAGSRCCSGTGAVALWSHFKGVIMEHFGGCFWNSICSWIPLRVQQF
ncbi:hypothetical protein DV515_00019748, partial [Chloebia gouldiae]